jgi:serine/threonine protein kinase
MVHLRNVNQYKSASKEDIIRAASDIVHAEIAQSAFLSEIPENAIPQYSVEQLKSLGKVLGRGGFCVVRELPTASFPEAWRSSATRDELDADSSHDSGFGRRFGWRKQRSELPDNKSDSALNAQRATYARSSTSVEPREMRNRRQHQNLLVGQHRRLRHQCDAVVKQVEPALWHQNRSTYLQAWVDVCLEAQYLASLSHKNIVKIYGMCSFPDAPPWLVLQTLPYKLPQQLTAWMHADRATRGITGMVIRGGGRKKALLEERIRVALDIARVMDYIHEQNIVYRDLVSAIMLIYVHTFFLFLFY